jgi:hypothetical protein
MSGAWYLTWQDPAALLVAVLCIALSLWLRARFATKAGCGGCAKAAPVAPHQPLIPARSLLRRTGSSYR